MRMESPSKSRFFMIVASLYKLIHQLLCIKCIIYGVICQHGIANSAAIAVDLFFDMVAISSCKWLWMMLYFRSVWEDQFYETA